ncbi:bifunctional coenzyme A synthase isoform X1 [Bactrocera tryoni]|uniref:bifunctional coenzyme A synthase isoform X1 n=2 Tax=Bactrocera tryoni TaxID=59916 RepID=UPI001A997BE7|nr:bifunctional coenzyme A synthase isoform X1 [Bactrocera tryoni]
MASTGLLIVSNVKQVGKSLRAIEKYVGKIYIHLNIPAEKTQPLPIWGHLISQLYVDHNQLCSKNISLSILVGSLRDQGVNALQIRPVDMLFSDSHYPELCERMVEHFKISSQPIYLQQDENMSISCDQENVNEPNKMYDTVVVGGTFDRIHVGHKIFLTQAVIRCCRRLVVGVTTSKMNKSKILPELILPVESRIAEMRDFLTEIDASLQYEIVPINDPFGPTKSDPNMDMIVVSAETLKGGHKVNEVRTKNNLRPLEIHCVGLVESTDLSGGPKEKKMSSSNTRIDLLGTRLKQPEPRPNICDKPYIIGLTGGIASGKSIMCDRLLKKGAQILDCDKIAHQIYEPDQVCYQKIINHFGKDIVNKDRRIDRKRLGEIVFNDPKQLETLNNIVWPELLTEVKKRIRTVHDQHKCDVVVIEAAILLKAGWENECHEVWSTIVTPDLAVQRITQRNGLSEEEARKRVDSQMENSEVVSKSHIVFSSQWSDEFTQQQADKAWSILMDDIEKRKLNKLATDEYSNNSRL